MTDIREYKTSILGRAFYEEETSLVAQKLLGKYIVKYFPQTVMVGRIVETEAYLPFVDPAAHGYIGKTQRNEVLFGEAGHLYIHSIHTHHCLDAVTESKNRPGSVLIRAIEPIEGIDLMKQFRLTENSKNLTNGPGKFCEAFQITRKDNGIDITRNDSEIIIVDMDNNPDPSKIKRSKRIGISKAKDELLRFSLFSGFVA